MLYGPQFPALPADLTGETFCRVFGTPQTSLEMFLLQQKIKGPGWLDISGAVPVSAQVSWCRLEATVAAPSQVRMLVTQDCLVEHFAILTLPRLK